MCEREQIVSLLHYLFGDDEEEAINKLKEHHRLIETHFGFDYLKDDKICVCAHILEKLQHDGFIFPINKLSRYILSGRCPHVQRHTARDYVGTTSTNIVLVAVALGKLQTVQYIVESGCSLDCATSVLKMTPLHVAVHRNDFRLFQYLVSQGVDVNKCCRGCEGEYSTLMLAVQGNCNEIVKELLLTTDINGNFRNINHKGALCCAVQNCSEDMINLLLSSGVMPTVGTLQKALDSNNSRVLEMVLSVGAPNLHKSVYKAAQQGNIEMLQMLLEKGNVIQDTNHHGDCYYSALHVATLNNDKSVVELLVEYSADVDADILGYTALDWAQIMEYEDIEEVISKASQKQTENNLRVCQAKRQQAIFTMFYIGDVNTPIVIEKLVGCGIDINIHNSDGNRPLHEAVYLNDLPALRTLLKHGANPNLFSADYKVTPLFEAVMHGNLEAVKILLDANAEMEVFTCRTLHDDETMIDKGQEWIVEPRNLPGKRSTLCEAVCKNLVSIAKLLLKAGFDIRVESKPCLEWMIRKTKSQIVRELMIDHVSNPRTLSVICRDSIRNDHRMDIKEFTTGHCLPPRVKEILLLKDLL